VFQHIDSKLLLGFVIDTNEHELVALFIEERRISLGGPGRATAWHSLEQDDVAHRLGDTHFFGRIILLLIDAIDEMDMIVVSHERVAALRDRSRSRLITFAAGLRRVLLGLELICEHALQRADPLDARPKPLTGRSRHSLATDPHPSMRATCIAQHDEEALHGERGLDRVGRLDRGPEEEADIASFQHGGHTLSVARHAASSRSILRVVRALLLGLLGACSFEHGVAPGHTDAQPVDVMIDSPPMAAQIEVGTIATTKISYATSGQVSYTVPTNASLLLVSLSTSYAGTTATAVRWQSMDLISIGSINAPSQDGRVEIWKLVAPPAGAGAISIVVNNTSSAIIVGVVSFYGTDPTTPHGLITTATGTMGAPTISLPSATGELAFGVLMWNGAYTTLAADSAQSSHWNTSLSDVTGAGGSKPGNGSTMLSWNVTGNYNDYWATGAISLRPSVQ
jgi:hypothetical protein